MSEQTPQPAYGESWQDVHSDPPMTERPVAAETPTAGRVRGVARGAACAVVGLIAGVVGVSAIHAVSGNTPAGTPATSAALPQADGRAGGGGPPAFAGGRDGGGFTGEQRVVGTLTAVGSSSVTVQTEQGTSTYAVSSSTDVERNGRPAALSALKAGDVVLVHLLPSGSGFVAERVLAGASSGRST